MTDPCCTVRTRPRDRIVMSARNLFHKHGIRGIGVDAIAEAAGTNKMTLYRHFGSKDDLICECLRAVADDVEASWRAMEAAHPDDPMAQLHDWIREAAHCVITEGRGCDLANAAVELTEQDHPARRFIEKIKTSYRDRLAKLCLEAGIGKADLLADSLCLLLEGARVSRQSVGVDGPSSRFIATAEAMIEAFAR